MTSTAVSDPAATVESVPTAGATRPAQAPQQKLLHFWHRGALHSVQACAPHTTLLDFLRVERGDVAVKEACAQGDCGACAVTAAWPDEAGRLRWLAINSCIKPAQWIDGKAIFSAFDLPPEHPVIRAMLAQESSQCGFCTPGFVMALFALYQEMQAPDPDDPSGNTAGASASADTPPSAVIHARPFQGEDRQASRSTQPPMLGRGQVCDAISGNLCRCTGYLPIIEAGCSMLQMPAAPRFEQGVERMRTALLGYRAQEAGAGPSLEEVLRRRAADPQAWVMAGGTDLGLRITKAHVWPKAIIDVSQVAAMQLVREDTDGLTLGAALDLQSAFRNLAQRWPSLHDYLWRFAGRPIRNSATLGGNLGTASPIGDAIPLLMVLGASLQLARWDGSAQAVARRWVAVEDFILGYRRTALACDELIEAVHIPAALRAWHVAAWKISKRHEDDISAVSLTAAWRADTEGRVVQIRLAVGGVAERALRLHSVENYLLGKELVCVVLRQAGELLSAMIAPISDARASARYRHEVCANLLLRLASDP